MTDLLKKISIFVVFVGVIFTAISMIFSIQYFTMVTKQEINGVVFYTFNLQNYLGSITTALGKFTDLSLNIAPFSFADPLKGLISVVNGLIMIINILLYPLRAGGYVIFNVLAILGMPVNAPETAGSIKWLIDFANNMTTGEWSNIPYIPVE